VGRPRWNQRALPRLDPRRSGCEAQPDAGRHRPRRVSSDDARRGGDVLADSYFYTDPSGFLRVTSNVVLYLADQDEDASQELYASYLIGPIRTQ
jgi:hypothetical protein